MLKYDELLKLLNTTNEITKRIQYFLTNSEKDNFSELTSLYSARKDYLNELQVFFLSGDLNKFSIREREIVTDLVKNIIQSDNQNISFIEHKVNEFKRSIQKIQQQKSLLIYSKS